MSDEATKLSYEELRHRFDPGRFDFKSTGDLHDRAVLTARAAWPVLLVVVVFFLAVGIFAADIATSNGYTIADKPGPRTLVFKPAITDLRINNPTNNQPYSITVLAEEAGQMRINLEMHDGESGVRVLTLSDFTRGLSYGQTLVNQNVVRNKQESTFIMRRWARSLNEVIATANESAART